MTERTEKRQGLVTAIDLRLLDVYKIAWEGEAFGQIPPELEEAVMSLIRCAYGYGYCDAIRDKGYGAQTLFDETGYLPPRIPRPRP